MNNNYTIKIIKKSIIKVKQEKHIIFKEKVYIYFIKNEIDIYFFTIKNQKFTKKSGTKYVEKQGIQGDLSNFVDEKFFTNTKKCINIYTKS